MANGVNVKMGVSGIAQFKQNMNAAKTSVKTLEAQLALNEKQFKATGDAETYMQQKAELLKEKLEEQKTIVANAEKALKDMTEKGVDKASTAFQTMQQQLLRAKGDLIDTESQINGVADAGEAASNEISSMQAQLQRIGTQVSFDSITKGIGSITSGMEAAARKVLQLSKAIIHGSMDAASYADDILSRSSKYGADYDAELVQKMDNVAAFIDTDTDTIINAQKRLRKAMGSENNKETMGAFAALGIDPNNTDWQDAFWKAGEALRTLEDDIEREEYATKIFGRSWDELNPLFEAGRQKYEQMLSEQTVLTNAQVEALGKEDDAMQKMQQQIDLLKNQFWAGLAPAITDTTNALSGLLEQFNTYLQTDKGQEMLEAMGNAVSGLVGNLTKIDPDKAVDNLIKVFENIKTSFEWISDNKDGVVTAIEAIAAAFAAIKVGTLATNIGRIVSGFKQFSWGSGSAPDVSTPSVVPSGTGTATTATATKTVATGTTLPEWLGFALDMSPYAIFVAEVIRDQEAIREACEKAAAEAARLEEKTAELQEKGMNSDLMKTWELMTDPYTKNTAGGAFFQSLIEHNKAWMDEGDAVMDTLADALNDDTWDKMMEILNTLAAGGQIYDGSTVELYHEMLNQVERMVDEGNIGKINGNTELAGATNTMKGLPGQVAAAVKSALSDMYVAMDGQAAGRIVARHVSNEIGNFVATMT